jgi:hypothetical protein
MFETCLVIQSNVLEMWIDMKIHVDIESSNIEIELL